MCEIRDYTKTCQTGILGPGLGITSSPALQPALDVALPARCWLCGSLEPVLFLSQPHYFTCCARRCRFDECASVQRLHTAAHHSRGADARHFQCNRTTPSRQSSTSTHLPSFTLSRHTHMLSCYGTGGMVMNNGDRLSGGKCPLLL